MLILIPVAILLLRAPQGLLTFLLLLGLGLAGLTALNLLACALWPARVERSRLALERFPLRSFLMGILIVLAEIFLIQRLPVLALAAVVVNLIWLAQGLPALASRIGQGLALTEKRATAAGTALMGALLGLPVLGWLGAACLGLSALGAPLTGER